ncbi:MAG: DUF1330 domain-containing protein [Bacteroidota bacterium]
MVVNRIHPTSEQLTALMSYPPDQPITMVNILKFRAMTEAGNETGEEAYQRYLKKASPLIEKAEAQVIWRGEVAQTVIGQPTGQPDVIFIVRYPSVQHFMAMISSPEYQNISEDRSMALEYGGLIACR